MPTKRGTSVSADERFPLAACGRRWDAFLDLEHETLPPPADFSREDETLRVRRAGPGGARPLREGGVPGEHRAALFLQGAAAAAFFGAHGFDLGPEDLVRARWDADGGSSRLWLGGTPRAVFGGAESSAAASPAPALEALIRLLFARGGRVSNPAARLLLERLRAPDAPGRRPEFWVAGALRAFPELGRPDFAPVRRRCLGVSGDALRSAHARALARKARALRRGAEPRIFEPGSSALTPGGALRAGGVRDAASASRLLREQAGASGGDGARGPNRPEVWIAVAPERWDALSREALESAAFALRDSVELVRVPESLDLPETPGEWRAALWVPCGTVAASVRFYEAFAERASSRRAAREAPAGGDLREASIGLDARRRALAILSSPDWARFAADPTGDAAVPEPDPDPERALANRPPAESPGEEDPSNGDPGLRIERLLEGGRAAEALAESAAWVRAFPDRKPRAWFPLAARLRAACGGTVAAPPWLEALEAEREAAGGRPDEARTRLERLLRSPDASPEEKRDARLRIAELAVDLGRAVEGARLAAAWRREHRDAPAGRTARALRLGAWGLAREGRFDCALALLEEAETAGPVAAEELLELALARARVLALAGRFEEEESVYESVRARALASEDDSLAARLLAQEARRLLDRREFGRAILRFEEALAAARDEPGERAGLLLDLAATVYHAGDASRSEALLDESLAAAAAAGREDLARIARGNRVELWIDRGDWANAAPEIERLAAAAESEKDDARLIVALHHRSRLALRRGLLASAAADNARARRLAARLSDRLEIGELWLEEGDRLLYEGDVAGARAAWSLAASDPADRCRRHEIARARLAELETSHAGGGGPSVEALAGLESRFETDPYGAAETVARRRCLFGADSLPPGLAARAEGILRSGGGEALADRVFGRPVGRVPDEALRVLRDAVSASLAGETPDGHRALELLGLAGLAVRDSEGREVLRVGNRTPGPTDLRWRGLEAGSARFELALWPDTASPAEADSVAMLLETLLYRASPSTPPSGFGEGWGRLGIVTADASMEEPYRRLTRFAPQSVTVLVLGASGSGKEAVARAVHRLSGRAAGPFVAVNIPAVPPALLESELFGHARGAFTGAERDRRGLLEEAGGGTIFFDEIGDLAPSLQAKLLRALQEKEIRRVGENRPRAIDARIVSATSRDLAERVDSGQFREDLFYRLHVAVIRLPSLKERGRDALVLARHFLERFAAEYGRGRLRLAPEAAAAIAAYPWPGNVRELQNAMSQAAALCDANASVGLPHLPERVRGGFRDEPPAGGYHARLDAHRRDLIAAALDRAGGNRSRAARDLGLSRQALHYLIRELRVDARRLRS